MMNPRRSSKVAVALCGTFVLAVWGAGSFIVVSSANIDRAGTMPGAERPAPTLTACAEVTDAREATAPSSAAAANAEVATATEPVTQKAAEITASPDRPESTVEAALPESSQKPSQETPPVQVATAAEPMTLASADTKAIPDEPKAIVEAASAESSQKPSQETPPVQVATAAEPVTQAAADTKAIPDESKPIVDAALPDASQGPSHEPAPMQMAMASTSDLPPNEVKGVKDAGSSLEIVDECLVPDPCIDRYLWALYQRTPKEDTNKVQDRRQVTSKRKGKTVTVIRSFTKLVDADFGWKDPKAAEKVGMSLMDYVIGGMDRSFKLKLYHTLHAAEEAGLSPGITSAFRDDYRQSIASGLKAATDRSYHGGSFRGGYGHGLAADIVSVKGATRAERWTSTENFWKWIDAHGKEFGIGRPYLDHDPPHVAPTDGQEYASHRGGMKVQHAQSDIKKGNRPMARADHRVVPTASTHPRKVDRLAAR
jgi:hypothetical protein